MNPHPDRHRHPSASNGSQPRSSADLSSSSSAAYSFEPLPSYITSPKTSIDAKLPESPVGDSRSSTSDDDSLPSQVLFGGQSNEGESIHVDGDDVISTCRKCSGHVERLASVSRQKAPQGAKVYGLRPEQMQKELSIRALFERQHWRCADCKKEWYTYDYFLSRVPGEQVQFLNKSEHPKFFNALRGFFKKILQFRFPGLDERVSTPRRQPLVTHQAESDRVQSTTAHPQAYPQQQSTPDPLLALSQFSDWSNLGYADAEYPLDCLLEQRSSDSLLFEPSLSLQADSNSYSDVPGPQNNDIWTHLNPTDNFAQALDTQSSQQEPEQQHDLDSSTGTIISRTPNSHQSKLPLDRYVNSTIGTSSGRARDPPFHDHQVQNPSEQDPQVPASAAGVSSTSGNDLVPIPRLNQRIITPTPKKRRLDQPVYLDNRRRGVCNECRRLKRKCPPDHPKSRQNPTT